MLPVSVKDIVRFTPLVEQIAMLHTLAAAAPTDEARDAIAALIPPLEAKAAAEPQPVYLIAVPSLLQRAAFRRDVRAAGATYPGDPQLYQALRDDLKAVNPVNVAELLAVVDEVEAANPGEVEPDALKDLVSVARIARALGGQYAALEGDREYWLSVAPIVAAQHFLLGVENAPGVEYKRSGALCSDETLAAIGEEATQAIGHKAMSLMRPTKDQVGNSASPSLSGSGRTPTAAARKPRTARLGNSSASATSETPASA